MSTDAASRPRFQAALAMDEETKAVLFDEPEWQQIEQLSILTSRVPLTDLADVDPVRLAQTEVLITGWGALWIGPESLEAMPALRYVIHAGGTVKKFLAPEVFERGIQVSSAAVANAIPVAEYTLASIIMGLKRASRSASLAHPKLVEG
ncbi:D-3-phosphoglycerate dehydrogenase [Renibacterium salmoninarum ATCC 33209]|uniref:D-3-phosphoglycerate dehydrogenase n=1 Tax=Renibacterium salmoninarum (strain ATCC 33209 / DSM 20767 / JCM 11484 / NBRC 15589 / NCIMB 2235) TaxID=288705 RepID=A9WKQ8_RENSM|nr:D-3-phosphoglycerate dehydrogenase [Renibacterium salmoninarum]ABY21867.1 D-3-phosphoglycerate dehydrogenase [Renibacterium salmoninarum ATCC 33209]